MCRTVPEGGQCLEMHYKLRPVVPAESEVRARSVV